MKKRTAIVTGGEGFIGAALAKRLLRDGWSVVIIDDFGNHDEVRYDRELAEAHLIQASVQTALMREKSVDVIYHLAGRVGPVGVMKFKGRIASDTIDSAARVAQWALDYGCPVIDISTSEIYGSPGKHNAEDDAKVFPNPASARMEYAVAKLAAETMLLNTQGLDVRIIRPFNVAGPGQRPEGGFVLPRFVISALTGTPLTVYKPGNQLRSFTHIDDIVDGIIALYENGRSGYIVNLGTPKNACPIYQLALEVVSHVGAGVIEIVDPVAIHGPNFKEAPEKVPNSDKASALIGWEAKKSRDEIICDTIEYWRERIGLV